MAQGYAALKLLQAFVVSLAAVPVFVLGRRSMADRYALLASVLTVAVPVLLYSGLVMTEVLFYPVAACALLVIAYAVSSGTVRSQVCAFVAILVAAATRPQAVVFVPVLAAAVMLDALCARDGSRLRSFWPTWLLVGGSVVALAAFPSLVGAYAGTLRGGYPVGDGLRLSAEHLSFAALACGLIPFAAVVTLAVRAIRGLEQDPVARAFISVCIAACLLLPLQVGFFAARYAPHLLGRNLAPLPPLLFLGFALWISRGATRGRVTGPLVAFGVASLVLLVPWNALVVPTAFADTFDLLIVARVHGVAPIDVVMVFALVMLAGFVFVPRRFAVALAVPVVVVLIAASAVAANEVARAVNAAQAVLGPDRSWIDTAASGDVAYLYEGSEAWNLVWQERFWNRRVRRIYSIAPNRVPGSIAQTEVTIGPQGALPISENYVVAADRLSLDGHTRRPSRRARSRHRRADALAARRPRPNVDGQRRRPAERRHDPARNDHRLSLRRRATGTDTHPQGDQSPPHLPRRQTCPPSIDRRTRVVARKRSRAGAPTPPQLHIPDRPDAAPRFDTNRIRTTR